MDRIRRFIQESVAELRKVTWPTLEQTRNLTVLVFVVSFAVGLFVAVCDFGFQYVIGTLSKIVG